MTLSATYRIQTSIDVDIAADLMAKEQSSGDWPHATPEQRRALLDRASARVVSVTPMPISDEDLHLPLSVRDDLEAGVPKAAVVEIEYRNFSPDAGLANLLNVIAGEPHHLGFLEQIKLIDFSLNKDNDTLFPGPRVGTRGIREILGISDRPLLCAPIKPATGLLPEEFAQLAYEAAIGGADILKEDELYFDLPYAPFESRIQLTVEAIRKAEQETGERKLFFANVTADFDKFPRLVEQAQRIGVDGVLACSVTMGFSVIRALREKSDLMVMSHNSMVTAMTRVPAYGLDLGMWVKIQRLSGADAVIMPTPWGSFGIGVEEFHRCVSQSLRDSNVPASLPGFAGGKSVKSVGMLRDELETSDYAIVVGGALFEHPKGVSAGARALREAIVNEGLAPSEALQAAYLAAHSYSDLRER
jgi:ribulose-bisphosphate carboxylase large chain